MGCTFLSLTLDLYNLGSECELRQLLILGWLPDVDRGSSWLIKLVKFS